MHKNFKSKNENVFQNKDLISKHKKEVCNNNLFETFFSTGITMQDLAEDPDCLIKVLENAKFIHSREGGGCGSPIHIKFNKNFYRFYCNCGMVLIYPPRQDRNNYMLVKWIPKKDFKPKPV